MSTEAGEELLVRDQSESEAVGQGSTDDPGQALQAENTMTLITLTLSKDSVNCSKQECGCLETGLADDTLERLWSCQTHSVDRLWGHEAAMNALVQPPFSRSLFCLF